MRKRTSATASYVRTFVFGVEDSLGSAIIIGILAATWLQAKGY